MVDDDLAGSGIEAAVRAAGSQEKLAELLGDVTQQAVAKWVKQGWAPLDRVVEIEAHTGVDRKRLVKPKIADVMTPPFADE